MKIEIAEPGRMSQTGSSLFRLMQNNDMPLLDLFVRESIQNSLDARRSETRFVDVDYMTGRFNSALLSKELEGITASLNKKYPKSEYDFLAIRDSNTVGLTGEMDYKKVKDNKYGNLLKLVYEICKPQDSEGAGGSWGIGKTVYFRMGIGLVVYYSRIKKQDGTYESRLAASYVEDEKLKDALIPVYKDYPKRGIAWWGTAVGENKTQPVTNEEYIESFLNIFNIPLYSGDETGTTILIPYIDSEKLLLSNQKEYYDLCGDEVSLPWAGKIEDYLKIATQRWYAPRLSNRRYNEGAILRLKINGTGISKSSMEPVFQVVQSLYNRANYVDDDDFFTENNLDVKCETIEITKYLETKKAGTVAFAKVPKDALKMNAPHNKPEPYIFLNCSGESADYNAPTVCYTRKPGMMVAYENSGAWVSKIGNTEKDEYIFAIFVLNSRNKMKGAPEECSLEEYIRNTEKADHASWIESSDGKYKPRIVAKIQDKLNKAISREYTEDIKEEKPKKNSGLGKLIGDMLLPPIGFGKDSSHKPVNPKTKPNPTPRRGLVFRVNTKGIKYGLNTMDIPVILETSAKQISSVSFEMKIDSESNKISMSDWENKMGLGKPFEIKSCSMITKIYNGENNSIIVNLEEQETESESEGIKLARKITKNGTCYGIDISTEEPSSVKAVINVTVQINRNDIKPSFVCEKEKNHE